MCGAIDKVLHGNKDVRYIAIEHKEKVRPGTGREAGLGHREPVERLARYAIEAIKFALIWYRLAKRSRFHRS